MQRLSSIAISSNTGFKTQIPTDVSEYNGLPSLHGLTVFYSSHKPPFLTVSWIKVTTGLGRITSRNVTIVLRQLGYGGQELKQNVWHPTGKAATLIQSTDAVWEGVAIVFKERPEILIHESNLVISLMLSNNTKKFKITMGVITMQARSGLAACSEMLFWNFKNIILET